jgi:O-succinylbenzoic acid--CoA ligase
VIRQVPLPEAGVAELAAALGAALDGGPAVLPRPAGTDVALDADPDPGTAAVVMTSGSTAIPKLVMLPAAALRASAAATVERIGGPGSWLLALPAHHVAGLQVLVRALLAGREPVAMDLGDGFRADGFAAATAGLPAGRRYTSLVPTQLRRLLDAGGAGLDALCGYDAVLVGGAALDGVLRARALSAGARVVSTYGMSETAGGCVYDGVALTGTLVAVDADGRIRLGGATLASGYLGRPDETRRAFAGGWFHTGDLGRWRDGRLEVLGRADDVINSGGEKVVPALVERILLAQPGVRAACVVGVPDPEWGQVVGAAVVVSDEPGDSGPARWRAAVRTELGRAATPRKLLVVGEIPVLVIGKPDRAAVLEMISGRGRPAG